MKIAYATDIHGRQDVYEKLFRQKVDAIIIGGDVSEGFEIPTQREFFESYLIPRLETFKKTGKPVLLIVGNDDYRINLGLLENAEKQGLLHLIHMKPFKLGKVNVVGYSYINAGPLFIQDWQKEESEIAKDLARLNKKLPSGKTMYVIHAPPLNTYLDVVWNGEHVGSHAIREFILKTQPIASLHGHIHESPDMSGHWYQKLGKTLIVNPGDGNIVILDLNTLNVSMV